MTETRLSKELATSLVLLNLNSIDISAKLESFYGGVRSYFGGLERALAAKESEMTPEEYAEARNGIAVLREGVLSKARDQVVPMAISALSVIKQFIVNGLKR